MRSSPGDAVGEDALPAGSAQQAPQQPEEDHGPADPHEQSGRGECAGRAVGLGVADAAPRRRAR